MRAIEQELSFHNTNVDEPNNNRSKHHRRSPTYNSYYSSATLIDSEIPTTKKIKKSSLFINRIFKKAFPKLYKNNNNTTMNLKYKLNKNKKRPTSSIFNDSSDFPRSSTDETLGVYSTTQSYDDDLRKPVNVLDLLPAMNHNTNSAAILV
jgi:hypothetical protein